ncbi:3691_t:CDS:2 [Cetraspora pellucida]|uniref:3691_t:CDS:1 n=1 Tax=Cetraspora pellucida TaxID=1433469 RepID=A0A9N9HEM7_9GLOM|nr:3691_t:CDS:2 [Cetraspora pellucida]
MSNWIEVAIEKKDIKSFKYDSFKNWEVIGRGGFGTVYSAYSEDDKKIVALKGLNYDSTNNSTRSTFGGTCAFSDPKYLENPFLFKRDKPSDIYSLGVLFWELSSGVPPFKDIADTIQISFIVISGDREDPVNETPIDFLNIYTNAWNGDPNLRPSITKIIDNLDNIKMDLILSEQGQDFIPNKQDIGLNEPCTISSEEVIIDVFDIRPEHEGFKTNTALAYNENLQVVAWGRPALSKEPTRKKAPKFKSVELFMLHLANLEENNMPSLLPGLDIKTVITDYLCEMNKLIKQTLSSRWPNMQYPQQVRFVLPVPDEWDNEAKTIMRGCMHKAGYLDNRDSENIVFITESEAATNYCMKSLNEPNLLASFLIVDCEGEIVTVITRTLLPGMRVGEVTERNSDRCGSFHVDHEFLMFLGQQLGLDAMKKLKENHYTQMQYLIQEFFCSKVKFSFNGNPKEYTTKELDIEFYCPAVVQYVTGQNKEQMEKCEWEIELDFQTVKDMFDPVIKKIIDLIQRQLTLTRRKCAAMFLIGEFNENRYLQTQIQQHFTAQIPTIIVANQPIAAIERSALEYGLNMDVVPTRVLKYCYGIEVSGKWEMGDPPERRTPSGCISQFYRLALKGIEVGVDQKFYYTFEVGMNQTEKIINVFITPDNNAEYCDEDGMEMLGTIKIDLSDSRRQRKLMELILTFGVAEVIATVVNKRTGQLYYKCTFRLAV